MGSATHEPLPGSKITDLEVFANRINLQTADGATIQKYVVYMFQQYADHNIKDYSFWEAIHFDFEDFKEDHFNKLDSLTWNVLRDYCYMHGYWIDHNYGPGRTPITTMLKSLEAEWYDTWTLDQIKWVENRYKTLSPHTLKCKQELMDVANLPLQLPGFGQLGSGQLGLGQTGLGQRGIGQLGLGQPGLGQPGLGQPGLGQTGFGSFTSTDSQTQLSQDISFQHGHQFSPLPPQECNNSAEIKADSAMIPPHQFPKPQERARQEREQCECDNQRREQQRLERQRRLDEQKFESQRYKMEQQCICDEQEIERQKAEQKARDEAFTCRRCSAKFPSNTKLHVHISAHHSKPAKKSMLQLPPTPTLPTSALAIPFSTPALATSAASHTFLAPATPPASAPSATPKPSYAAIAGHRALPTPPSSTPSITPKLSYAKVAKQSLPTPPRSPSPPITPKAAKSRCAAAYMTMDDLFRKFAPNPTRSSCQSIELKSQSLQTPFRPLQTVVPLKLRPQSLKTPFSQYIRRQKIAAACPVAAFSILNQYTKYRVRPGKPVSGTTYTRFAAACQKFSPFAILTWEWTKQFGLRLRAWV